MKCIIDIDYIREKKRKVKLLKKATKCGFLMVLRWFAENIKKFKK